MGDFLVEGVGGGPTVVFVGDSGAGEVVEHFGEVVAAFPFFGASWGIGVEFARFHDFNGHVVIIACVEADFGHEGAVDFAPIGAAVGFLGDVIIEPVEVAGEESCKFGVLHAQFDDTFGSVVGGGFVLWCGVYGVMVVYGGLGSISVVEGVDFLGAFFEFVVGVVGWVVEVAGHADEAGVVVDFNGVFHGGAHVMADAHAVDFFALGVFGVGFEGADVVFDS